MESNFLQSLLAKEKILNVVMQEISKMVLAFLASSLSCYRPVTVGMPDPWLQCSSALYSATDMPHLGASCSK